MQVVRARIMISGRVQGVNFRMSTREEALARGVAGWVKNRSDGRVEALFEGAPAQVEHLLSWCRQGPRYARVEHVDVQWENPTGQERTFRVIGSEPV